MSYHDYYQPEADERNYDAQPTITVDEAIEKYEHEYTDHLFETEPKAHNEEWLLEKLCDGESFYEWLTEKYGYFILD